jgi:hypothetical protein
MFFLAGAAANGALDIISTLQKTLKGLSSSSSAPANGQGPSFDVGQSGVPASGASSVAPPTTLDPNTMNALLMVQGQGQPPLVNGDAFSTQLFSLLDGNGDGGISQSEFATAIGQNGNTAAADAIFAQLDANHDGSVSQAELTNALSANAQNAGGQQVVGHHHHHHGLAGLAGANAMGGSGNSNDPFASNGSSAPTDPLLAGDTSKTVTNPDGSQTTTITYADGSTVTMTMPAAAASNSSALAHNMMERMIQHQAQMIAAASAGQGLALNA